MDFKFEWDEQKARINERKHGVTFTDATTAFADPFGRVFYDEDHSLTEDRFVLLGYSASERLLIVCFSYPDRVTVRIFSARRATAQERKRYESR